VNIHVVLTKNIWVAKTIMRG